MIEKKGFAFSFDERACESCNGHCCIGESGYIWVSKEEITAIAAKLEMDVESFKATYLEKVKYKYTIREVKKGESYECVFFDSRISGCTIYDVRPTQCRTFPFWDYFLKNPKEAGKECPGIVYHS